MSLNLMYRQIAIAVLILLGICFPNERDSQKRFRKSLGFIRNCRASLGTGGAGTSSSRLTSDPHAVTSEHEARYKVAFVVNEELTFISLSI